MTTTFDNKVNSILTTNGLDFTIEKRPLLTYDSQLKMYTETPYFGLVNGTTNECINTVKKGYHISQNREIVELVLKGIEPFNQNGENLKVTKAGSINGGRKVFLQLAIEGDSHINGDKITQYITILDSNDGSSSLSIGIGDLTASCSNQFWKFYKESEAKFRHSASIERKMLEIPYLIQSALSQSIKQIELYRTFESTKISRQLADEMVKHLLGVDRQITSLDDYNKVSTRTINIMDKLYDNIDHQLNDKGLNLWGLHSGLTRYTTHELTAPKRNNGKIESMLSGSAYKLNQSSLEFCAKKLNLQLS